MFVKSSSRGNTLVEMLIVVAIIMVVLTGMVNTTVSTIRSSESGKLKTRAIDLAQQSLESVKNERDTSWSTLKNRPSVNSGLYCISSISPFTLVNKTAGQYCQKTSPLSSDMRFGIQTTYETVNTTTIQTTVTVEWFEKDPATPKTTSLSSRVTNWR